VAGAERTPHGAAALNMGRSALVCCSTLPRHGDGKEPAWSLQSLKACTFEAGNISAIRNRGELREFSAFVSEQYKSGSFDILAELAASGTGGDASGDGAKASIGKEAFVSFLKRLGYLGDKGAVFVALDIEGHGSLTVGYIRSQLIALDALPTSLGETPISRSQSRNLSRAASGLTKSERNKKGAGSHRADEGDGSKKLHEEHSTRSSLHASEAKADTKPRPRRLSKIEKLGHGAHDHHGERQNSPKQPHSPKKSPGREKKKAAHGRLSTPARQADGEEAISPVSPANAFGKPSDAVDEKAPPDHTMRSIRTHDTGGHGNEANMVEEKIDFRRVVGPPTQDDAWDIARRSMLRQFSTQDAIGMPALDDDGLCVLKPLPYRWGFEDDNEERNFLYKGEHFSVPMLPIGSNSENKEHAAGTKAVRGTGWQKLRSNVVGGNFQKLKEN